MDDGMVRLSPVSYKVVWEKNKLLSRLFHQALECTGHILHYLLILLCQLVLRLGWILLISAWSGSVVDT